MKKKVIKDFKSLPPGIKEQIRLSYPQGFMNHMISFFDKDKQLVSALPYETEDISYLIKMPSYMHLVEEEEENAVPVDHFPETDSIETMDEEKFLIEEGEEEDYD